MYVKVGKPTESWKRWKQQVAQYSSVAHLQWDGGSEFYRSYKKMKTGVILQIKSLLLGVWNGKMGGYFQAEPNIMITINWIISYKSKFEMFHVMRHTQLYPTEMSR